MGDQGETAFNLEVDFLYSLCLFVDKTVSNHLPDRCTCQGPQTNSPWKASGPQVGCTTRQRGVAVVPFNNHSLRSPEYTPTSIESIWKWIPWPFLFRKHWTNFKKPNTHWSGWYQYRDSRQFAINELPNSQPDWRRCLSCNEMLKPKVFAIYLPNWWL